MSIFALTRAKDPVIQRVQGIAKVRLLKAVVIQNLQCVQNPANSETYRDYTFNRLYQNKISPVHTEILNSSFMPTCCGFLTLVERPAELHSLSSLFHLLFNLPHLGPNLRNITFLYTNSLDEVPEDQMM